MSFVSQIITKNKFTIKCSGSSMKPIFQNNDILYFNKIPFPQIRGNHILMIRKNRKLFVHRVIYKNQQYIITKGDNNLKSDGKIFSRQIIGKVMSIKRGGIILKETDINLIQSTLYYKEILKIKKDFKEKQIECVFLKGLPLHLYYERSYPKRIYADCDILINRQDQVKASNILEKYGFHLGDYAVSDLLRRLKNRVTEVAYIKKKGGFHIVFDVHFDAVTLINQFGELDNLYPTHYIEYINRQFLKNWRFVNIHNEKIPILSQSDLIIYSAYNIYHHNFRGIFRYDFLDKIIVKEKTNEILKQVQDDILKYKLQNFIYPVFILLKKYYSAPLPKRFLETIKPEKGKVKYIKANILDLNIFDDETRIRAGINRFKNLFFLSPNPLQKRLMIIFNIRVVYTVLWVIIFLARSSLIRSLKSLRAFFSFIPYRLAKADKI